MLDLDLDIPYARVIVDLYNSPVYPRPDALKHHIDNNQYTSESTWNPASTVIVHTTVGGGISEMISLEQQMSLGWSRTSESQQQEGVRKRNHCNCREFIGGENACHNGENGSGCRRSISLIVAVLLRSEENRYLGMKKDGYWFTNVDQQRQPVGMMAGS